MGLKIGLLCNDGSPIGVIPADIYGRGLGGAELSMITMMETLASRGHDVTVFNDPKTPGTYSGVKYEMIDNYQPGHKRDVTIIFRSPNKRYNRTRCSGSMRKIWWSTDQYTIGSFQQLAAEVDYVVTISPYHTSYHHTRYSIPLNKMSHIDLGVRDDFSVHGEVERIPGRLIFASIPDRGLRVLHSAWPLIKRDIENASLVITSDYTLWGSGANVGGHRLMWANNEGVQYVGNVPRRDLTRLLLEAEIMAYPSVYEELFCVSAAEAQYAGAMPITSKAGALTTTNEFGLTIPGDPATESFIKNFAKRIVDLLGVDHDHLQSRRASMMEMARRRFDWNVIAERWEELFETGRLR